MSLNACSNKSESLEKSSVSNQENNTQVGENIESDTSYVALSSQENSVSDSAETTIYDKQLQLIANQASVWIGDTESVAEPFFYAVTDLDQNGRLEIIQSSCQGTGLYTYTNLWEVDANGTELIPCQLSIAEGDSQPDIIADPEIVYYDETGDCYFYIFRDEIRNGAAEHYQSQIALSLQDGVVTTTLLSQMSTIYTSGGANVVITYMDADGNTIDEDIYNMTVENTFAGLTAMETTIGWTDYTVSAQLAELTEAEIMNLLKTSWESFSLNKA
jgi:hypothetical protein